MSYWQPVKPLATKRAVAAGLFVVLMVAASALAGGRPLSDVVEYVLISSLPVAALGVIAARTNRRLGG